MVPNNIFTFYLFTSGPRTGPKPTPPKPSTTTSSPVSSPKPTEPTTTTPSVYTPVEPSMNPCKVDKFDVITEIQGELHFFKNG